MKLAAEENALKRWSTEATNSKEADIYKEAEAKLERMKHETVDALKTLALQSNDERGRQLAPYIKQLFYLAKTSLCESPPSDPSPRLLSLTLSFDNRPHFHVTIKGHKDNRREACGN